MDPDDAQAHANIGTAYKELKLVDIAVEHFQQSISLAPKNPSTHNNLGNMYKELGQLNSAIECYKQALALHPGYPEACHNLGSALLLSGRYAEAD